MKNLKLCLSVLFAMIVFSCQNDESTQKSNSPTQEAQDTNLKRADCITHEIYQKQLAENPSLAFKRNQIESFTQNYINNVANSNVQYRVGNTIVIPVVFNILWSKESEKISTGRCQSQINVLNRDFNGDNTDYEPGNVYNSVKGSIDVRFVLSKVNYKKVTNSVWDLDFGFDQMKDPGLGIRATDTERNLNIWVVGKITYSAFPGTIFAFAQMPGMENGAIRTDGIVSVFNTVGNIYSNLFPDDEKIFARNAYLGRTITHEVGHWMNLFHIWGDEQCGDDLVADTPTHDSANYENDILPNVVHRSLCAGRPIEMYWNYMDYTPDRFRYMFTRGQANRMKAVFAPNGPRSKFSRE